MGTRERLVSEKITFATLCGMEQHVIFTKKDIVNKLLIQGFPNNTTTQNRVWTTLEATVKLGALQSATEKEGHRRKLYSICSPRLIKDKLERVTNQLIEYDKAKGIVPSTSGTPTRKEPLNTLFFYTDNITEVQYIVCLLDIIAYRFKPFSMTYIEKRLKKEKYTAKNPMDKGFITKILGELVLVDFIELLPSNPNLYRHTEDGKANLFNQLNLYKEHLSKLLVIEKSKENQPQDNKPLVGLLEAIEFIRELADEKFTVSELEKYLVSEGIEINFQGANSIVAKLDKDKIVRTLSGLNKSIYQVADRSKMLNLLDTLKQQEKNKTTNPLIGVVISDVQMGKWQYALTTDLYAEIDMLKNQRDEAYIAVDLHKETSANLRKENENLRKEIEELKLKKSEQVNTFTPKPLEGSIKKDLL
jgi:hypothetical protein